MRTGRKTRLRRILRRKRIKRAIKAYGNYIAAGVLVFGMKRAPQSWQYMR